MNPIGFLLIAAGAFSLAGGIYNWDWYMNSSKAKFMCKILTRGGARIFYVVVGTGIIVFGVLTVMNII